MYDRVYTRRKIESAADTLNALARQHGRPEWAPTYHSRAQIDHATAHLDELWDAERKKLRRPLTKDESAFIQNERRLCALDFRGYWLQNYAWIINWRQEPERFTPNVAQNIIMDLWGEREAAQLAIWMFQLKARRLGVSTLSELTVQHRFQFCPDSNCVVASADPTKSLEMAGMIAYCLSRQPWWLMPQGKPKISQGMPVEYPDINTSLTIQAGNQFTGVARGATPNVIHLCVAPETLVRTAHGMLKPIVKVQQGDEVVTHTGKIATVKAAWKSDRRHELATEIWLWGTFAPLTTTQDHRIWTTSGWVEAGELRSGDYVRYPVRSITNALTSATLTQKARGGDPKRPRGTVSKPIALTREVGWLCGLYLAEGCSSFTAGRINGVRFAGDLSEVDDRIERIRQAVGSQQHVSVERQNSRTRILGVHNAGLGRWLCQEFGERDAKRIPDWAWDAGQEFAEGIVDGYLRGDGHYAKRGNEIYASSVRVQLPLQIRDLIASLGHGWSAITYKSAGVYYERNCREQWTLVIAGQTATSLRRAFGKPVTPHAEGPQGQRHHWRYAKGSGSSWVEIEIESIADAMREEFYDLEVDDPDHSFTTAQCAISNSEMSSWPDAREQIDGSLMKAVVDSPNVFAIMETTAWGTGNWVHDTWELSKAEMAEGRSRILPVFLPWFVGTDLYPSEADLRARPIPENWQPSERVLKHAERARAYVLSNPLLQKHLAKGKDDWTLPREQMWYHEIEYDQARKKKELNIFLSELPADDFEAFQSPNLPIIDPEILIGYQERTRPPVGVFTIVGPDIPQALVTPRRYWDTDKPPIPILTRELTPKHDVKYQLIPLKFEGYPSLDPDLKLLIWEWPSAEHNFGIGVDCSEGIGQDLAAIEVLREATPYREPGQVAEWASSHVTAFQLWPLVMAVGCLYSTYNANAGRRVQCRLAIEAWTNGSATQNELQKRGWSNFHPWKYNDKRTPTLDVDVRRVGVYTNQWFRMSMFDMLLTCLKEEAIDLPSPYLVQELTRLERRDGTTKVEASYGAHDDRVMGIGFPLFSLHMNKPPVKQYARKRVEYQPGDNTEPKPNYAVWQPDSQGLDVPNPALMRAHRGAGMRGQVQLARVLNGNMPRGYR